jgi:hypothetical protein
MNLCNYILSIDYRQPYLNLTTNESQTGPKPHKKWVQLSV